MTTLRTVGVLLLILGTVSAVALMSLGEGSTPLLQPIPGLRTLLRDQGGRAIGQAQRAIRGGAELPAATKTVEGAETPTPAAPLAGTPLTAAGPTIAPPTLTPAAASSTTEATAAPDTATPTPAGSARPGNATAMASTATPGTVPGDALPGDGGSSAASTPQAGSLLQTPAVTPTATQWLPTPIAS